MSNNALAISYFEMPNPVMEWLIINVKFYLYKYFFYFHTSLCGSGAPLNAAHINSSSA